MSLAEPLSHPSVADFSVAVEPRPFDTSSGGDWGPAELGHRLGVYLSLLVSLQAKHAPTAAHCMRVARNISAWGLYFNLPENDLRQIELAGLLHDLGKIGIPERILLKPSELLPEERSVIDAHPKVGIEILRSAGVQESILDSIQHLGVWYDHSNRTGPVKQLSLFQRILTIVDAFDAMTSEQTYRRAMSTQQALNELRRMGGRQFDPRIVETFVEVVENADDQLRQEVDKRWKQIGANSSFGHLFDNEPSSEYVGSVAIQALNQIFHRQMMDQMDDGVIFVDTELRILEWNKAAESMTGIPRTAVLHSFWTPDLLGLCDLRNQPVSVESCPLRQTLRSGERTSGRFRLFLADDKRLQVEAQLMPVFDEKGGLRGGAILMDDASDQADLEEMVMELHAQATQDPLTKVCNRAELNRQLPLFVSRCQTSGKPGSILICDIDFFKRINDTFGHPAGDEALKVFASVLKEHSRQTDVVARYGGEEFVILCDDCDLASAVTIGETIRSCLQKTPIKVLKGKCITASFGVSSILPNDTAELPLERADKALLQAKQAGRDRVIANAGDREAPRSKETTSGQETKNASSWLAWFSGNASEALIKADLLSSVPRGIVIEKLKGFVAESKAELLGIDGDKVLLRVDCRYAPMQRRANDRPTLFELRLQLQDVEVSSAIHLGSIQQQTRLKLEVHAVRQRDRRTDVLVDQANRLRHSFQAYLVAHEVDANMEQRMIPVFKPGQDGR